MKRLAFRSSQEAEACRQESNNYIGHYDKNILKVQRGHKTEALTPVNKVGQGRLSRGHLK